jgi:hypothetical protein
MDAFPLVALSAAVVLCRGLIVLMRIGTLLRRKSQLIFCRMAAHSVLARREILGFRQ